MFQKEASKKHKKARIKNINFYKIGKYLLTTTALLTLTKESFAISLEETTMWEKTMSDYYNKIYDDNNTYDLKITNLYNNGKIVFENNELDKKNTYLVYGIENDNLKICLVDVTKGYYDVLTGEEIVFNRDGLVKFYDTTAFIDLINNEKVVQIVDDKIIILDINGFKSIVDNWDGYIHEEVKETNNAYTKQILKRDNYVK